MGDCTKSDFLWPKLDSAGATQCKPCVACGSGNTDFLKFHSDAAYAAIAIPKNWRAYKDNLNMANMNITDLEWMQYPERRVQLVQNNEVKTTVTLVYRKPISDSDNWQNGKTLPIKLRFPRKDLENHLYFIENNCTNALS